MPIHTSKKDEGRSELLQGADDTSTEAKLPKDAPRIPNRAAILKELAEIEGIALEEASGRHSPSQRAVGRAIALFRSVQGLTQIQVSDATGLSENFISQLENGHRNGTLGTTLEKLANLYSAHLSAFEILGHPRVGPHKRFYREAKKIIRDHLVQVAGENRRKSQC